MLAAARRQRADIRITVCRMDGNGSQLGQAQPRSNDEGRLQRQRHMAAHAACKAGYHALLLLLGLAAASLCAAGENRSSRL